MSTSGGVQHIGRISTSGDIMITLERLSIDLHFKPSSFTTKIKSFIRRLPKSC